MATEYFILSNFGVRYFMKDYVDSDPANMSGLSSGMDEITSVLSCDLGPFSKDVKKYRTLNGNGWESIAPLGQSSDDATFECVREGTGAPYVGADGVTTYQRIKNWFMNSTKNGGETTAKYIYEVIPRGNGSYEGTCYCVIPNKWTPGTKDTETGQEFQFTVSPFGPQTPCEVSYNSSNDTFTFAAQGGGGGAAVTGVYVYGNDEVTIGSPSRMVAVVTPSTADQRVAWSVSAGTGAATIDQDGVLRGTSAGTVTVTVISVGDMTKNGNKTVTVEQGV